MNCDLSNSGKQEQLMSHCQTNLQCVQSELIMQISFECKTKKYCVILENLCEMIEIW